MTSQDLIKWRKHMRYNRRQAAEALGAGPTSYRDWETGRRPITDKRIAYACSAIALGVPPWPITPPQTTVN